VRGAFIGDANLNDDHLQIAPPEAFCQPIGLALGMPRRGG
jgi:hypothetical protein